MALGNGQFNSGPLVFLSPRNKDADGHKTKPHFSVARVGEDNKIAQTTEEYTNVTGDLVRIEVKERTFEAKRVKETKKEAVLYFRDSAANETYRLGLIFGIASCSLFNALYALKDGADFTGLSVDYYENKKGYDAYGLKQNGTQVKWAIELSDIPAGKEINDDEGNLVKRTYKARDAFFEEKLMELAALVNKTPAAQETGAESEDQSGEDTGSVESETTTVVEETVTAASIAAKTKTAAAPVTKTAAPKTAPAAAKSTVTTTAVKEPAAGAKKRVPF